jgi:hypothetical protein
MTGALQFQNIVSNLRTAKIWAHAVVVASQEIVQDFGYVPMVVELRHL